MATKVEIYKLALQRLFPKGRLWSFIPEGVLDRLLNGVAVELARIDDRGDDLQDEADPRTTAELLTQWETMVGLPGACGALASTVQDRRNQVVARLNLTGPQNKQFYVDIAASLGYDVDVSDITDFDSFRVGHRVNTRLTNGGDWPYTFLITVPEFTTRSFRAGQNSVGDRLLEFGDDLLECLITEQKPAHAIVLFRYI